MFDLDTIMKAIQFAGPASDAGKAIYDGFVAITGGEDQAGLKERYAAARQRSDDLHNAVQRDLSA